MITYGVDPVGVAVVPALDHVEPLFNEYSIKIGPSVPAPNFATSVTTFIVLYGDPSNKGEVNVEVDPVKPA